MHGEQTYTDLDLIVVGAGMVGLTAALAMQQYGFKVLVIDGREDDFLVQAERMAENCSDPENIDSYDNRVSALTCASENILHSLNVWPKIAALRHSPYRHMQVWDGEGSGSVHFSAAQVYQQRLGHIVENKVALAALLTTAAESDLPILGGARVIAMSEPESGQRQLTCQLKVNSAQPQQRSFSARLIVGADGAMSKIRQLAAIPLWQWDYGHHAIVATVATQQEHQSTAWQRFTSDGPLAFLPLADPHLSSIVWSTSPAHANSLMAMDEQQFSATLSREFEQRLGAVTRVCQRAVFPLRQRHAKHYVQQGLALIGDACHTIHPLAGQGVNLGLLDAAVLAETLDRGRQRGQSIDSEALLKQFQRARHGDNLKMSAAMQAFKWLFDPQPAPLTIARNFGMNLLDKTAPLKQHIIQQAMGLSGELPQLARQKMSE
ncbi:MAG: hypothetical protein OFPI_04180 [Osedax symbiont Rs2]|nr:MAG: hypothetical protein OFPI_04180 [Osedax symbiont Rs2]